MNLALVVEDPSSTKGPDIQANNLLKALDTHADHVDTITVVCKRGTSPNYRSPSIETADILDAARPVASLRALLETCRRVDLVHLFAADWRIVLPVLGLSRTPILLGTSTSFRALPQRLALRVSKPTAVFSSVTPFEIAINEMGFRRDRTFFVPNGIDTDVFTPPTPAEQDALQRTLRDRHGLTLAAHVAIWVNHLNDHKRPRLALRAFQQLKRDRDDVSLLVIGDGPNRPAVEDLVAETPGAHVLGFVDHEEIHEYYRAADLNLVTSRSEGISNVIYEGMACGLPAVTATAFDQVGTGEYGRYLPPDASPTAIADGMDAVLERRAELGRDARAHVVRHHGLETFADRYEQLYAWCVGRGPRPALDETWKADTLTRIQRA